MAVGWWSRKENERWLLGGGLLLFAVLVLLPRLGAYGLADPHEIAVAEAATRPANSSFIELWSRQPPLTTWLIHVSVTALGRSEFAARLPMALLGLVGVAATYALAARMGRRRGGAIAALVLLSSPLYVFQARQLVSDVGAVTGGALAMLGLFGLAGRDAAATRSSTDLVLAVLGLIVGLLGAGLFLGVVVPIAAVALASAGSPRSRRFALGAGLSVLGILVVGCLMVFHIEPAPPGAREVFGRTLVASKDYLPWLGGSWRQGDAPVAIAFDNILNQIAFGMYPWSAIAPIAVLRLALVRDGARTAGLLLAWATVATIADGLWWRGFGDVRYQALPAIALAIGLFIDDLLVAKTDTDSVSGHRIAGIFVFLSAVVLALDAYDFPDELPTVHVFGARAPFPQSLRGLVAGVALFGLAFGVLAGAGLFVAAGPGKLLRIERRVWILGGLVGALGTGALWGPFLAQVLIPPVAQSTSYKKLFDGYFARRHEGEPIGVMGIPGWGPEFYAGRDLERLDSTPRLVQFLNREGRVFAIAPKDKLCEVRAEAKRRGAEFHLLDVSGSRYDLYSNRLLAGEKDENPVSTTFKAAPPAAFAHSVRATFDDTVEVLGVDMPAEVEAGGRFNVTLWLRVKKRPWTGYKVSEDFEGATGHFQGDHDRPGICSSIFWQTGDIIADTHEVSAAAEGVYTLRLGFYTGVKGFMDKLKVTAGAHDDDDRVVVGTVSVK